MGLGVAAVWVPGHPRTKGSLTAVSRARLVDTPQSKTWRRVVTLALRKEVAAGRARYAQSVPVTVRLTFYTPYAPTHPWAGDLDKLERNVLDAMKGVVITDDRYVVSLGSSKIHALGRTHGPGAMIEVWEAAEMLRLLPDETDV